MNSRRFVLQSILPTLLVLVALAAVLGTAASARADFDWKDSLGKLPPQASTIAPKVDDLYYMILALTGVVFFGVEFLLLYFIIRYRHQEGKPAHYTHGNKTAEVLWTVTPALILTWLALYQKDVWFEAKQGCPKDPSNPNIYRVEVLAQQFQWNFRYPGADGKFKTPDDIQTLNQLYVPVDHDVVIQLTSRDVIHSLFIPVMRIKQDAVPGIKVPVWFHPTLTSDRIPGCISNVGEMETAWMAAGNPRYTDAQRKKFKEDGKDYKFVEIACAELCGSNHFKMRAFLTVMTKDEIAARLKRDKEQQGNEEKSENWGWDWNWAKTAW